jgi:hypothetical protein
MKIDLNKYLKLKRNELDVEQPDDAKIWQGIRKELHSKKYSGKWNLWKIAAIFLAVFTLTYIIHNELIREKERTFSLNQINKSLGQKELEYQQMVFLKMQAANIGELNTNTDIEIISVLINELDELDMIYQDAMRDLEQHGYLEQIVSIIFDTYEKRIRILEQIIMESQKLEMYENDNEEIRL